MENKVLVSAIVPVYNAEKYLHQTLDSLIHQTLREIEIICVDDGSSDRSVEIVREYAARDPRVISLVQENAGAGTARNYGLSIARGEYVHFLDADDYMFPDAYAYMYAGARRFDADMVKTRVMGEDEQTGAHVPSPLYDLTNVDERDFERALRFEDVPGLLAGRIAVVPWNGIYRRELLMKENIRFNTLTCVNDRSFYNHMLVKAKRYVLLPEYTVHHRVNISTSLVGRRVKFFSCQFESYKLAEKQSAALCDRARAAAMSTEFSDLLFWYNKYKKSPEYGKKITQGMKEFVRGIDVHFFFRNGANTAWKARWEQFEEEHIYSRSRRGDAVKATVVIAADGGCDSLERCLASVTAQTLSGMEILCAPCGDAAKAREVIAPYVKKDARVRVLAGDYSDAGAARNAGLAGAKGSYLLFLDANVTLEKGALKAAYAHANDRGAEICVLGAVREDESGERKPLRSAQAKQLPNLDVFELDDVTGNRLEAFDARVWDKLIARDLLERYGLAFMEQKAANSLALVMAALLCARRICVLRRTLVVQRGALAGAKDADCLIDALIALRGEIEKRGYTAFAMKDYLNAAARMLRRELERAKAESGAYAALCARLASDGLRRIGVTLSRPEDYEDAEDYFALTRLAATCGMERSGAAHAAAEKPAVSVIVPVICADYLSACMESLSAQTLEEIEILCAPAADCGDAAETLYAYAQKDARVRVIDTQKETFGALGNAALSQARGEYAVIVSARDCLTPDALEKLLTAAKAQDAQIVKADEYRFARVQTGGLALTHHSICQDEALYGGCVELPKRGMELRHAYLMGGGMIRTDMLGEIRMNEKDVGEFALHGFWLRAFALARRAAFVHEALYMKRLSDTLYPLDKALMMNAEYEDMAACLTPNVLREVNIFRLRACSYALLRTREEDKWDYLQAMREDFRRLIREGRLEADALPEGDRKMLGQLLYDPAAFLMRRSEYIRLHAELFVDDVRMSEMRMANSTLAADFTALRNSHSYKAGMMVTFLPRKLRGALRHIRRSGLRYTAQLFVQRVREVLEKKR